jgi:hypothetical protein
MLTHTVLFVTKQLNLFPVKGGLSSQLSPKQIMSGKVVNYKYFKMGFGRYCQIHEEDEPRNSNNARMQGAISLGHRGNAQGGHKFYTLTTGKVVNQRAWTELPTPESVIKRVHTLTRRMPYFPIFTDRNGQVIGDVISEYDDTIYEIEITPDEIPGVHTEDTQDKITGVDTAQVQDPTPSETKNNDLDFAPTQDISVDPPLIDTPPPIKDAPAANQDPTVEVPRRSTRVSIPYKQPYIPSMSGKKYSYATTKLGTKMLKYDVYDYNKQLAFSFMQQLSVKAAIRK